MELLMELYRVSSPSGMEQDMIQFICSRLYAMNVKYNVDKYGNIYAVKGKSKTYPCLAAHTDEVHSRHKHFEPVNFRNEIVFGYDTAKKKFRGIGADDKNGIWINLKCLESAEYLKCVFFTSEETGCIGSTNADLTFFDNCRFVVQCDRRGNEDFISKISNTELCSEDFIKAANPRAHGFKRTEGMQTDVLALKQGGLSVSCVNLSCGYYNPHTDEEYTRIDDLMKCFSFVKHIINKCCTSYPHKHTPQTTFGSYNYDTRYLSQRYDSHARSVRGYVGLVREINRKLAEDEFLGIDELMDELGEYYSFMDRYDFEQAYYEAAEMLHLL